MTTGVSKPDAKINLFSGISRTLALSFILFAMVPMTVISIVSYRNAHKSLKAETEAALKTAAVLRKHEIQSYFDSMLNDIRYMSDTNTTTQLLAELEKSRQASGKPLDRFVGSYSWTLVADKFSRDIKEFRTAYNYYDIFLINKNGDILFSIFQEDDLGTNVFTGKYRSSKFAAICRETLETGKLLFSDYERYSPSGKKAFGFLTCAVVGPDGDRKGVLAFQFPIEPINHIMQAETGLGATAEIYLVGPDLTLRSKSILDRNKRLIKEKILTKQSALLEPHIKENGHGYPESQKGEQIEEAIIYTGPHGYPVLGIHHDFRVQNVGLGVIAEISENEAFSMVSRLRRIMLFLIGVTAFIVIIFTLLLVRRFVTPVLLLSSGAKRVEQGDFSHHIDVVSRNEIGDLAASFNAMMDSLRRTLEENTLQDWIKTGRMDLGRNMSGASDLSDLCNRIIRFLIGYMDADIGALYVAEEGRRLKLQGRYALPSSLPISHTIAFGEGLVGQAALEKQRILLDHIPEDYFHIQSGLGKTRPRFIVIKPCGRDGDVINVIEMAAMDAFSENALMFLDLVCDDIAITIQTVMAHTHVQMLLEKSQAQAEELEVQQEELRQTNEKLAAQSAELQEQTAELELQKSKIQQRNADLEAAQITIEQKAKDLETASRYKSEFLANMSHELRTPLNGILLLSKHLSDNKSSRLSSEDVACTRTIYSSGQELLKLINDVLDLSKIEAGKVDIEAENVFLHDMSDAMEKMFMPVAEEKGLEFTVHLSEDLPEIIYTDGQRLSQILRNLLANAIKFTEKGDVSLEIFRPREEEQQDRIAFAVKDTGIGIPEDKLDVVFDAFQQGDGSISRHFGGTGLGLSLSRQYAGLLGGDLSLSSRVGEGSVFTLVLPENIENTAGEGEAAEKDVLVAQRSESVEGRQPAVDGDKKMRAAGEAKKNYMPDDRKIITPETRSVLIIEDDLIFAKILCEVAREKGFKVLVAETGESGLHMTDYYKPDSIILDMVLPGMNGRTVISRLKENLSTRHIPIHVISGMESTPDIMHAGVVGYFKKPVTMEKLDLTFDRIEHVLSRKVKDVLVVEDDQVTQALLMDFIGDDSVNVTVASTGEQAKALIAEQYFDCMILDLGLPDMSGIDLLKALRKEEKYNIPVIIHTAVDLTSEERAMLDKFADRIVMKNTKSQEKLLDEVTLFLHQVETELPEEKRKILEMVHDRETILKNKKILVVDDDMRNVFALISILQDEGIMTEAAKNGEEALRMLKKNPDIDLVIMDIMMPVMDGYEAMRAIRKMPLPVAGVPVIALTAKAMKGDRAKCIEAGASDYLSKPVDTEKLLSMLRVWLY